MADPHTATAPVETAPPIGAVSAETRWEQLFPPDASVRPEQVAADLADGEPPGGPLTVGDPRLRDYLHAVGSDLSRVGRRFPELAALGFFLRPAAVDSMLRNRPTPPNAVVLPRGYVFHLPPGNVDTLFLYSWALAVLTGNRNVVRLSERAGPAADEALRILRERLTSADPVVGHTQRIVRYGHDPAPTAVLSAQADLRVIWGGDMSIAQIRRAPLPAYGSDLTFADRSSFAVVDAAGWLAASPAERDRAAEAFCTDAYWFDQAACASPRTVFWVGPRESADQARLDFHDRLVRAVAAARPEGDGAMAVLKRVSAYGLAAEGAATSLRFGPADAVAVAELAAADRMPRHWLGAGLFAEAVVGRLDDITPLITRRDQTVSHYGFDPATLAEFGARAAARGVDRLVPFGEALRFSAVWDGHDLLTAFTRLCTVQL